MSKVCFLASYFILISSFVLFTKKIPFDKLPVELKVILLSLHLLPSSKQAMKREVKVKVTGD